MSVISAQIRILPDDKPFWTNNETITGVIELRSDREVNVKLVQASIVCEEWVHTGSLEFKEHYRQTSRVWPHSQEKDMQVVPHQVVTLPVEIRIPPQKYPKKYPPSFCLRYNSISWCIKMVVVSSVSGSAEVSISEAEKSFCMHTCGDPENKRKSASIDDMALDEHSFMVGNKDFQPVQPVNPAEPDGVTKYIPCPMDATMNNLPKSFLHFKLLVPQQGLLKRDNESTPVYLETDLENFDEWQILELTFNLVESADTYYKDPLLSVHLAHTIKNVVLTKGMNKLVTEIKAEPLKALSEDFKTEWQNVTHNLRLNFLFYEPFSSQYYTLKWVVPVKVQSPAKNMRYIFDQKP